MFFLSAVLNRSYRKITLSLILPDVDEDFLWFSGREPGFSQLRARGSQLAAQGSGLTYRFGTISTRADTAEFFSVPPRISAPIGVNTIPRLSARTS